MICGLDHRKLKAILFLVGGLVSFIGVTAATVSFHDENKSIFKLRQPSGSDVSFCATLFTSILYNLVKSYEVKNQIDASLGSYDARFDRISLMYPNLAPVRFEITDSRRNINKITRNSSMYAFFGVFGVLCFLMINYPALLFLPGIYMLSHVYNSSRLRAIADYSNEQHGILTRFSNSRHFLDVGETAKRIQQEKSKKKTSKKSEQPTATKPAAESVGAPAESEEVFLQCDFGTALGDLFGLFRSNQLGDSEGAADHVTERKIS